ncbi:MAG: alpha/beta fold hydrolase [Candidatus Paceibacterota bacterium]
MTIRTHLFAAGIFITLISTTPVSAQARAIDDISYASIKEARGDTILIKHSGPNTDLLTECTLSSGTCRQVTAGTSLFPTILGSNSYQTSPDGALAVYTIEPSAPGGGALHFLYTLEGNEAVLRRLLPFNDAVTRIRFSDSGEYLIAATAGGDLLRYSVPDNTVKRMATNQRTFPFFQVSSRGTYVSAYNYSFTEHLIWNLDDQSVTSIAAIEPAFVEFNADENEVAYATRGTDGFPSLAINSLPYNANNTTILTAGTTVRDYLYAGNDLFVIDNDNSSYAYDLFRITDRGERELIAEDVSYGEYLREENGKLLFFVHDDARTVVVAYDPESGKTTQLNEPEDSPSTFDGIKRSAVTFAGRNAVLWEPEDGAGDTLFVWLHGGPKRQTSLGYHPFLSYAVYDAVLADMVHSGASVMRLDYTGSEGYSAGDQERLVGNIGKVEVDDIIDATRSYQRRESDIEHIYLIGNSYGGYLALRSISEKPDLFDGAISINGVTNWYDLLTSIPSSIFGRYFNGPPDLHNLDRYFAASVFSDLPNVPDDAPILLFYGENDTTIPPSQSINYHAYAQTLDKNATLVNLPEEDHILRKKESLITLCSTIAEELDLNSLRCN